MSKDILLELVQGPYGQQWIMNRTGWRSEVEDVCQWEGVTCNNSGDVTGLYLKESNLAASIPSILGSLTSLTQMYLKSNSIFGTIPQEIANLPNLVHVDLSSNVLRGTIPLFTSEELEFLNLSHNQLTGTLPDNINDVGGNKLKVFDVKFNRLDGSIPSSIGMISSMLVELDLSSNVFDGPIPESLGSLTDLKGLFLANNALSGSIPVSLTRSNLALSQLFLHGNALSGTLPVALADLPYLKNLFVDDNKLTGIVPAELCALNLNEVFFQGYVSNANGDQDADDDTPDTGGAEQIIINGVSVPVRREDGSGRGRFLRSKAFDVEDAYNERQLVQGYSGVRDGCNSIACPPGYFSNGNGEDGVFPCEQCDHEYLNPYLGAKSCFVLDQLEIMSSFFDSTGGHEWNGDYDMWPSKTSGLCNWTGIACNANGEINSINLPDSNVKGSIPANLGFLPHLEVLNLTGNSLTGELPSDLHFAPLEVLDISGNYIVGFVPATLCEKSGVNQNGRGGKFGCDKIACAVGTFSATGKDGSGASECESCTLSSAAFLGANKCNDIAMPATLARATAPGRTSAAPIYSIVFVSMGLVAIAALFYHVVRKRDRKRYDIASSSEADMFTPPSDDEIPTSYISSRMPAPGDKVMGGTFSLDNGDSLPFSVQVKARNAWNSGKESTKEVWLDVPKIN